ncbi:hypothetical protein J6590_034735 [Homalodisca vitripennis]|nr:hypothetical protein J6590_034735 [Homalodisca vitripennis]
MANYGGMGSRTLPVRQERELATDRQTLAFEYREQLWSGIRPLGTSLLLDTSTIRNGGLYVRDDLHIQGSLRHRDYPIILMQIVEIDCLLE